ncbi:MAG TPA: DoxX family protein [Armatimonadota bacterium]|nr:DoxX family protein [Armatimonadota bacterium]
MSDNCCADSGMLLLRAVVGGMVAGHGAQKLFGVFGGPGPEGIAGFMEQIGLKPGGTWGTAAGLSEFCGGTLTALGFLHPLGPVGVMSAMSMATAKVHWGKPIWAQSGGAELPVAYAAAAAAVIIAGPGRLTLDKALGIRLPWWVGCAAGAAAACVLALGVASPPPPTPSEPNSTGQ